MMIHQAGARQLDGAPLAGVEMMQASVKSPLMVIKPHELRVVFSANIDHNVTFRQLLWVPCPDNIGLFKPKSILYEYFRLL